MKTERGRLIVVTQQAARDVELLKERLLAMHYQVVGDAAAQAERALDSIADLLTNAKESDL